MSDARQWRAIIFGHFSGQFLAYRVYDGPRGPAVAGHGRQFVKHPAVQLDLLRLGQRQGG